VKSNFPGVPGIYKILNLINGKFYIGSTKNLKKRRWEHYFNLRHNRHPCHHLQSSFNKYGEEVFEFICVEFCDKTKLMEREQYWLDEFWDKKILYNTLRGAYIVKGKYHPMYGKGHLHKKFFGCMAKNSGTGKCSNKLQGRFCTKHRNQYQQGIIDKNGNKLRDLHFHEIKFPDCLAKNSGTGKCIGRKYGRFCRLHNDHYRKGIIDKNGNKLRDLNYGLKYKDCIAKNSGTGDCWGYKVGRFCRKHYSQFEHGIINTTGEKLRDLKKGKINGREH
jgi:group I intron endonuclease